MVCRGTSEDWSAGIMHQSEQFFMILGIAVTIIAGFATVMFGIIGIDTVINGGCTTMFGGQ
jgi:hypothetical protein